MKILIVVDMQNDFVTGKLGTKEAVSIIPAIEMKILEYQKNNDYVIFTMDTHYTELYDSQIESKYIPEHCIMPSHGWKIVPELDKYKKNFVKKRTFAITSEFSDWLTEEAAVQEEHIESIELCGVCTDICVVSNALCLRSDFYNTPIVVDASCCAGTTPENHEAALKVMKSCLIDVIGE